MIVIISPERMFTNETAFVNLYFENGLDLFHLRKYEFSDDEIKHYLNGINEKFRRQMVLHSHFHLAEEFGIDRLHVREQNRIGQSHLGYEGFRLSTSVHRIDDFNALDNIWQYAFLSPIFPSISKVGYGEHHTVLNQLKRKNNKNVQLIGLGGIQAGNCRQVIEHGADGIALLGSIWQSCNPLNTLSVCRKIVR